MEYCITTNFDLFEVIKLISPWLLAFAVYFVWHWQKEKEVIANEAKALIKDLLELSNLAINIKAGTVTNKIELESKMHNFKELSNTSHRGLLFINKSKNTKELDKMIEHFYTQKEAIYILYINNLSIENKHNELFIIRDMNETIHYMCKNIDELINLIHPYSLYKNL